MGEIATGVFPSHSGYRASMRMERLLADLEAAEAARRAAQARLEIAEGVRAERATVSLPERLGAAIGSTVDVTAAGHRVKGLLAEVGHGWVAIDRAARLSPVMGTEDLVHAGVDVIATDKIESIAGLGPAHVRDDSPTVGRTWGSLLRAIARSRTTLVWRTASGQQHTGIIDAVGSDHAVLRRGAGGPIVVTTQSLACIEVGARRGEDYA